MTGEDGEDLGVVRCLGFVSVDDDDFLLCLWCNRLSFAVDDCSLIRSILLDSA